MMKIKALVEIGDDEVEVKVTLPYFYKDIGWDGNGQDVGEYVKVDSDKVSIIFWKKSSYEGESYAVRVDEAPRDWRNTSDTFYFAGKKENSLSAKGFDRMKKKATEWLESQQQILAAC